MDKWGHTPPDTTFDFTTYDENFSVESEFKEQSHKEEKEYTEQLLFDIWANVTRAYIWRQNMFFK